MQTGDHEVGRDRTAIIVSGMHRSGTSAITRLVSLLGAALPNQLIDAREDNERGFWEGRAVVDLNKRILKRFESWWGGWDCINTEQQLSLTRMVESARRLVRAEFGEADLIVLKDPRIARLLPLWTLALEKEGFRCVHIMALRTPSAVAGSLARRDALSAKAATLSWLAHTLDAEADTRGQQRVVVSFENVLRDWRAEADRISRALAVKWPEAADDVAAAIGEFVEPNLVHERPVTATGPAGFVAPVYDVLRRWSEDDIRPEDTELLDSWRAFLDPIRGQRSAVQRVSTERGDVIAGLRSRRRQVGPLGSAEVWSPIRIEGFNVEAAAAWNWLKRERQHTRAARRATRRIADLERVLAEQDRVLAMVPNVVRRLGRRPLSVLARRRRPAESKGEQRRAGR